VIKLRKIKRVDLLSERQIILEMNQMTLLLEERGETKRIKL